MSAPKNLVNLNVNPCKMCMPMGAVSAMYGIRGCMTILHGSQGCATYIRRHMATHYNEPIDVASSSLTEEGTVFGGEKSLLKGIDNLITLYHPEVVAIATTCLAETIGEDVGAILNKYRTAHSDSPVRLISVSSAGFGGTQNEGYFRALRAVVEQVCVPSEPTGSINIITPQLSPADARYLKELLNGTGLRYTLLPDISDNLDGGYTSQYKRLPQGGTALTDIAHMSGARMTLELSSFVSEESSPARYLSDTYGVPYMRLPLPIGLEATDAFLSALRELGAQLNNEQERARLIDGMIDAHKYNGKARAVVYGEPDFVLSTTRALSESGVLVCVAATGSVCPSLAAKLDATLHASHATHPDSTFIVRDDTDFAEIEALCTQFSVNILVGSSDGRRFAHRMNIPLVHCAFPIHDRVGGQRLRLLGYEGAHWLMEQTANAMIEREETSFRQRLYDQYYLPLQNASVTDPPFSFTTVRSPEALRLLFEEKTAAHPCFSCGSQGNARIHLPVAPKCNIQCRYCVRSYDCPNESRPGVTTSVLSPEEAADKYIRVKVAMENLTVVGIAGPGDALANFEETARTLRLIRQADSEVTFCLSTNGLMLPMYAQQLIDLGVSHITVTVNAVDPTIGAQIYTHIDYLGRRYTGVEAASILLANQLCGIRYLAEHGVVVKVNCVVLKGINEDHIEQVVQTVKQLGAFMANIMQLIPVKGSTFEHLGQVSMKRINQLRDVCSAHLKQMHHCRQCRADAVGTLDKDVSYAFRNVNTPSPISKEIEPNPSYTTPEYRFAVATKSGMLVDMHFGHAEEFYIYASDGQSVRLVEKRRVDRYCTGPDCEEKEGKMERTLATVSDCHGVLALRIGDAPTQKLQAKNIKVITTYDRIEEAVLRTAREMTVTMEIS